MLEITEMPGEYVDDAGVHVLCGCGHYVSGGVKLGDLIDFCPNCWLILRVTGELAIVRPDRLSLKTRSQLGGNSPEYTGEAEHDR